MDTWWFLVAVAAVVLWAVNSTGHGPWPLYNLIFGWDYALITLGSSGVVMRIRRTAGGGPYCALLGQIYSLTAEPHLVLPGQFIALQQTDFGLMRSSWLPLTPGALPPEADAEARRLAHGKKY